MVKTNSLKAWFLAARPKTLTGAIAPVLVGAAFAFANCQLSTVNCQFALCLLFAIFMQINANLINDYFDFKKGTDREDRLGPERACAQGWITPRAMQWGIAVMTFLSCCVGLAILLFNLQWELLLVGIFCVLFCFLYTTHLSYLGWGDLLVLIFFGFVPVVFTCYVMCPSSFGEGWGGTSVLIASLAMGLATDNLLMVNNYRDRHQDKVSGKRTIIVRIIEAQIKQHGEELGRKKGEKICLNLYLWLGIIATILAFISLFISTFTIRLSSVINLIYLFLHFKTYRQLETLDGKALNQVLGATARNIFLFGLLLAISVLL
ncbi:MAG: 1,4-dihydroxy-2-naphthoate octaprenyltransferase [Bacteroidaceae bacterium]|nr:1,4-dihydroxy-2-naphthoate octaprenyltransferase [Bacteroidaceae bacterium]